MASDIQAGDRSRASAAPGLAGAEHSLVDPITRGPSRGYFLQALEQEVRRQRRYKDPFCLLLMRIDGYEALCEQNGRAACETLLWESARLIGQELRDSDLMARLDEGEFGLLLVNTPAKWAEDVAERVRVNIGRTPFTLPERALRVSMSGGLTEQREDDSTGEILERAREALEASETAGGDRVGAR